MDSLDQVKKVFLIGIGGVGMSALAVILKKRGVITAGSDRSESTTVEGLRKQGIEVFVGHSAENITPDIDLVVYTNAIAEDNPEFLKAKALNITLWERARMLNALAASKYSIGVSGTHGKTSTTSMVSKIFLNAGLEPSLAVGGYLHEIDGSGHEGNGKTFIYEACEAYESFLRLHPDMALITNIDADHLDYYKTFSNVKKAFKQYIEENIPPHGLLIYNADDTPLRRVVRHTKSRRRVSVGIRKSADFMAANIRLDSFSSGFSVFQGENYLGEVSLNIPGIHNVTNALLAIAAGVVSGVSFSVIQETLANFKNADRRFQLKLSTSDLTVIDDYAHHPSEIDATLSAAKIMSNQKHARLIAVFQPHLYSRTEFLYKEFARSLSRADCVVLTDIYAAREKNDHNVSSRMIYDEVVRLKGEENVIYSKTLKEIPEKVKPILQGNNILITLGAGDVWKVSEMFHA